MGTASPPRECARTAGDYRPRYRTIAHEILDLEGEVCTGADSHRRLDEIIDEAERRVGSLRGTAAARSALPGALRRVSELLTERGFAFFSPTLQFSDTLAPNKLPDGGTQYNFDCDTGGLVYVAIGEALGLRRAQLVALPVVGPTEHQVVAWTGDSGATTYWDPNARAECALPEGSRELGGDNLRRQFLGERAMARKARGDLRGAIEDLRRVISEDPDAGSAHNNLAWLYLSEYLPIGAPPLKEVVELAQRAVSLRRSAATLDTLGCALAQAGRRGEAVIALEEALAAGGGGATQMRLAYVRAGADCQIRKRPQTLVN